SVAKEISGGGEGGDIHNYGTASWHAAQNGPDQIALSNSGSFYNQNGGAFTFPEDNGIFDVTSDGSSSRFTVEGWSLNLPTKTVLYMQAYFLVQSTGDVSLASQASLSLSGGSFSTRHYTMAANSNLYITG